LDQAGEFSHGVAKVAAADTVGYIDRRGKYIYSWTDKTLSKQKLTGWIPHVGN
jgi:hypothetical protein